MTADEFLAAPTDKPSAEAFLNEPASAEAFLSSATGAEAQLHASAQNPNPPADLSKVTLSPYDRYRLALTRGATPENFSELGIPPNQNPDSDFVRATHGDAMLAVPLAIGANIAGSKDPEAFPFKPVLKLPRVSDEDLKNLPTWARNAGVVANQINGSVESFLTPEQLAQLPAMELKAVQGMYLTHIAANTPDLINNIRDAKTSDERLAAQAQLGIQLGMGALMAKGIKGPDLVKRISEMEPPTAPVQTSVPAEGTPTERNAAAEAAAQMPEQQGTIAAQLDWLKSGKRTAVLLTPGETMPPLPEGTEIHPTDAGTFVYDPAKTAPEQIDQAVADNKIGDLLGYGIADKPAPETAAGVVTIRGADGMEKQAVVTDEANLQNVIAKAKELAGDGDTVQVETPQQVLTRRSAPVPAAPVETPAARMAREQREAAAALRAQTPEPITPPADAAPAPTAPAVSAGADVQRGLKAVEITKTDYDAARQGNDPFMRVSTATGLAKDIKRAQEFGQAAFTERPGETEPVPVQKLYVGDHFKLKGEPVKVTDWVTDAETGQPSGVKVEGAYGQQFVPVEQTVHIDKNSLSDSVTNWLDKAIAATEHDRAIMMEGVSSAPYWMSKAAVNGALKLARFAYTRTRDISRSVGEAIRFIRSQNLSGYNEQEAMNWLESNLRGDPVIQDAGRAIGSATEERRPLLNSSPRQNGTASNISTLPFQTDLQSAVTGEGWRQRVGGWLGGLAGETFPRTTRVLRELGEQGARWIASRHAALPLADAFTDNVLRGLDLDELQFGAALHEDNLRSIKAALTNARAAAIVAGDVAAEARLRKQIDNVFTFVGESGVFKDENGYQSYLREPQVQEALRRHRESWAELIEPMYKEAMRIDPGEQLPARGAQTGARINLNFVREGEPVGKDTYVANPSPRGQLSNVLQKRSPFGRLAKGTAAAYQPSYVEAMRNTYGRQLEIANRNKFDRLAVESGNAVIDKPGKQSELRIKGEGVTPFEIKRTVVQANGQRIPSFENIYVRNSLAHEYRSALNLDPRFSIPGVTPVSKLTNGLALGGLTELSAHLGNLSHALMWRPGVTRNFWTEIAAAHFGRADALLSIMRALGKFTAEDRVRLKELAEVGALRDTPPEKSNWNPTKWGGKVIERLDERTRIQLDRMYQNLADQGLVEKNETARREFVNQVGQYNRRAQGQVMHWLRDTGVAPFITAGRAFNVLALKTAMLSPGVKTTSFGSRLATAATMVSKINGTLLLVGTLNYLLTRNKGGGVTGRPGTPLGAVDLGIDDKNRRPMTLDVANILGLKRVARVTGIRGAAESLRYNLPIGTTLDSTFRDIANSWTAPFLGPVARTASIAVSGQAPAIGVPRVAPVVPPGKSQTLQNLKTAAIESQPVIAGIHDSMQPGATGWEWLQRQAGRFTLQPGKPAQMVATPNRYEGIVDRAQAANYVEDVIARARKMQGADRNNYVRQSIMSLQPADRPHALLTLEQRGIIPPGTAPR